MARVSFTYALKRFFPGIQTREVDGSSVVEVLRELEAHYPGLSAYIVDDQGRLRKHVNIFVNNALINDKEALSDTVKEGDEIYFMQALSGG